MLAALLVSSAAFAFTLPETPPIKPEPEGPDVQLRRSMRAAPSGLDGLVIR